VLAIIDSLLAVLVPATVAKVEARRPWRERSVLTYSNRCPGLPGYHYATTDAVWATL